MDEYARSIEMETTTAERVPYVLTNSVSLRLLAIIADIIAYYDTLMI